MNYLDGEELYADVQRFLRSLSEEQLVRELNKLKEHCHAVISQAGAYVTLWIYWFYQDVIAIVFPCLMTIIMFLTKYDNYNNMIITAVLPPAYESDHVSNSLRVIRISHGPLISQLTR